MINIPQEAPAWAQKLARDIDAEINRQMSSIYPLPEFTVANKPPANNFRGCMIWLSDGAGNRQVATSSGTAWYYSDGTAV